MCAPLAPGAARCAAGGPLRLEHHDVALDQVRLHVVTAGPEDGVPVLLLHGFPEYWGGWRRQIDALVGAGHRVIVPDQRGYNLSDKPTRLSDYRRRVLAADVVGLIDWAGVERIALVGHDWGGAVAWFVAQHHPQRVERLIVLNMPHLGVMRRALLGRQLARSWYVFAFQLPWLAERALGRDGFAQLERAMFANSTAQPFTDDELADYRRAWGQPGALRGMLAWYRAAVRYPLEAPASDRVTRPTLLIWGRQDQALGFELATASLVRCDQARLVVVDEAAHFVQHDAPERVNAEILAFLGGA